MTTLKETAGQFLFSDIKPKKDSLALIMKDYLKCKFHGADCKYHAILLAIRYFAKWTIQVQYIL